MKQRIGYYTLFAAVALLCAVGCSEKDKDNNPDGTPDAPAVSTGVEVQFSAGVGSDTRTSHTPDGKTPQGFVVKWTGTDTELTGYDRVGICVGNPDNHNNLLAGAENVLYRPTRSASASPLEAVSGAVSGCEAGKTYNFYSYYPYDDNPNASLLNLKVPDLTRQTQAAPDDYTHLRTYDFLVARQEGVTIENSDVPVSVDFHYEHLFTSLQFRIKNKRSETVRINKITLSKQDGSELDYLLQYSFEGSYSTKADFLQLAVTAPADLAPGATQQFWMMVCPAYIPGATGLTISVEMNAATGVDCTYSLDKAAPERGFEAGGNYTLEIEIPEEKAASATQRFDDYKISAPEGIVWLAALVNNNFTFKGITVTLTEDIDMNGLSGKDLIAYLYSFDGIFDGQHHKIRNLEITETSKNTGFFGEVRNAVIKNVHVVGAKTSSLGYICGGLCGRAINSVISGCSYEGEMNMANVDTVGGIVASAWGNTVITGCKVSGSINIDGAYQGRWTGGILGVAKDDNVKITACYSDVTLISNTPRARVGGIIGDNGGSRYFPAITACYFTGSVTAANDPFTTAALAGSLHGYRLGEEQAAATIKANYVRKEMTGGGTTSAIGETTREFGPGDAWPSSAQHPAWTAAPDADGAENRYWKDLGSWNGGTNPVYPRLWWE